MKLNEQRRIYKISSTFLKANKWNLDLPLDVAMTDYNDFIVTINDSQLLRWIDELNGTKDITAEIKTIKELIKKEKSKTKTTRTAAKIKALYQHLYQLQFCPDYICVVIDKVKDYDRANKGFAINGIKFKRLLGTTGGIKTFHCPHHYRKMICTTGNQLHLPYFLLQLILICYILQYQN